MKKLCLLLFFQLCFILSFAQTKGTVKIVKDPLIDSLIARRIQLHRRKATTTNTVSRAIVSQMGYRVQVFYGADRKQVFNEQARFKMLYPHHRTYITYKEPNYYLRVGDFRSRLEAQRFLSELRPDFTTLFIFREKINAPDLEAEN